MRFLFVVFFSFSTLFMSGCWWEEEEVRGPISDGLSPKALFNKAQEFRDQGALDEAIKTYEQLQAAYPSSKYSMQSKLETPYALYKRERYDEAIDKLNDFIKIYPNHFSTPYAFYLRGVIAEDKSKSILDEFITDNAQRDVSSVKNAMNYYLALMDKFPNTEYAIESKAKLVTLRNILARHELFVAIFYTKKEAYIASINRCKYIIEKFPNTPSVPAALHLIAHNYDKINAPKLAEDSRRVLKASYPKYTPHYSLED
jgi:outer membrane protein assembly factor BamD